MTSTGGGGRVGKHCGQTPPLRQGQCQPQAGVTRRPSIVSLCCLPLAFLASSPDCLPIPQRGCPTHPSANQGDS